ncbi:hypothetical protein M8J76_010495 [Diaphorina citri]|nr:hypothetical protein M8J75_005565 [Diaphorina citri]KAI5741112.1 hypothetical protein M8J76_010495 [Diaphorina citri]
MFGLIGVFVLARSKAAPVVSIMPLEEDEGPSDPIPNLISRQLSVYRSDEAIIPDDERTLSEDTRQQSIENELMGTQSITNEGTGQLYPRSQSV